MCGQFASCFHGNVKELQNLYYWTNLLTLFYLGWGKGREMPYPSVFLKYLKNYSLNWLEIFKVWFSNCLKAVPKKLLKIRVRKALNHALFWMTSYRKKSPKIFFSFFSMIFHFLIFCHFHVVFVSKNHLSWK